jgi:hypothetical protein
VSESGGNVVVVGSTVRGGTVCGGFTVGPLGGGGGGPVAGVRSPVLDG